MGVAAVLYLYFPAKKVTNRHLLVTECDSSDNIINNISIINNTSIINIILNMAPNKEGPVNSGGKNYSYVKTGKPRGRKPGTKNKKTLNKEKMRERAAEMRKKGGREKKN